MSAATLEMVQARSIKVGDRVLLDGRGRTPWRVTSSYERDEPYGWALVLKRGREHNVLRTFADSWFDKVI